MIVGLIIFAYVLVGLIVFAQSAPRMAWKAARNYNQVAPDNQDKGNAAVGATILGIFWGIAIPCMLVYSGLRLAVVKGLSNGDFWAEPKPIQNPIVAYRENKNERARAEIEAQRKQVNAVEKELGWELTKWKD